MRPLRNTERVLANAGVERLLEKERALGDAIGFADIAPEVAGVYPRVMRDGDMDAGAWSCGMVAGLIHDIPTVGELVARNMSEARAIIAGRPAGLGGEPERPRAYARPPFRRAPSIPPPPGFGRASFGD